MRSVQLFCCCVFILELCCSVSVATADNAATQSSVSDDQGEVDSLLPRLAAENFRDRDLAEDRLVRLGASVIPRVKQYIKNTQDLEARSRAESILSRIAENEFLGATIVSIHARAQRPIDVFTELGQKANVIFWPNSDQVWSPDSPAVSIDLDHVEFWTAVREIGLKCSIEPATSRRVSPLDGGNSTTFTIMTAPGTVALRNSSEFPSTFFSSGPFLFSARASRTRGPKEAATRHLKPEAGVWLDLVSEPKLMPVTWQALESDPTADNNQQPMKLIGAEMHPYSVWGRIGTIQYRFEIAPRPAGGVSRFRGKTRITLATKIAHFESKQLLQGVSTVWHAGHVRFEIAAAQKPGKEEWRISANAILDSDAAGWESDTDLYTTVLNGVRCRLMDEHDQPLASQGGSMSGLDGKGRSSVGYAIATDFVCEQDIPGIGPIPGPPVKVIWDFPTEITTMTVPFDFKDLKL